MAAGLLERLMAVSREEVSEMERLRRIMGGEKPTEKPMETTQREANGEIVLSKEPTTQDINEMAKIMKNFSQTTGVRSFKSAHDVGSKMNDVVTGVVDKAQHNHILREALNTEKIEDGVRIGAWEIRKSKVKNHIGKPETRYRLYNPNTNQSIKAQFLVLESAKAIVKLLNNGATTNHSTIREIAKLEIDYRRQRKQALEEKYFYNKARESKNRFKQDLYEAKFDAARSRALYTRERIKNIFHEIKNL